MNKRIIVLLGFMGALGALLAAACGDDGSSSNTSQAGPSTTAAATAAASPTQVASDPNATLHFAWSTDGGKNYDPHTAANPFVNTFLYPVYDRLINLTPAGKLEPQLAESWSFKNDGKVMELKLRRNVAFQDGAPFDADAVKANIDRALTNPKSTLKADAAVIDSVVVVDQYTVDVNLKSAAASLPALFSDRLGMMISPKAFNNPDLDLKPVGAGPYKVITDDPGKLVTYEKFDKYWNPTVQRVAKIELSIVLDPATRLRALRSGQLDATNLNPDQIKEAKDGSVTVTTVPYAGAFILYLNMSRPNLSNVQVRKAMSMAIDRKGIGDSLQSGQCPASDQVFPAGSFANDPAVKGDFYKFDTAAAKKLLSDAGLANGFTFTSVVINVPFYARQAEAVQAQLAEIGIKMDLREIEPAQLLSQFAIDKSVDSYFSTTGGFVDPAKTVAQLYLPNSTLNPGAFADPKIVDLAAKGLQATDEATRAPIYQQISKETVDQVFHIPVCNGETVTGTSLKVQGLVPNIAGAYDLTYASLIK